MKYHFDEVVNRRHTNSLKYDCAAERGKPENVLPLWVADMDFRAPEKVMDALKAKAEHGIFGYSEPSEEYFAALTGWFFRRHGWQTYPEKFVLSCGVAYAICTFIRILTEEGDGVLICPPVYYPFSESVLQNGRTLVESPLVSAGGVYRVDFEDFEKKIVEKNVKLFLLCSPHNPVGRVWSGDELRKMGEICMRHNVFVVADEIHADFVFGENRHIVFATLGEEFLKNCAVCTAPTKTFNLAGLHIANIYIENDAVREKYVRELNRAGYSQSNVMGIVACEAAYTYGEEWLEELKAYLTGNLDLVRDFLKRELPEIKLIEPQGTYLIWLDCSALGMKDEELGRFITDRAKLWLDDGSVFGAGGSGFERVNIACPRKTLKEALLRLKNAVEEIR